MIAPSWSRLEIDLVDLHAAKLKYKSNGRTAVVREYELCAQQVSIRFAKVKWRRLIGNFVALDGVSLRVNKGEVACLMGPSGSGKPTFLRCTTALETISGGSVLFDGVPLPTQESEAREVRQRRDWQSRPLSCFLTSRRWTMLPLT